MTPGQLFVQISVLNAKDAVKLICQVKEEWESEQRMKCYNVSKKWGFTSDEILNAK